MYVIKRIAGFSAGRYMAEGLVNTTADINKAHVFLRSEDAQLMAHATAERVVPLTQEKTKHYKI